MNWNNYDYKSKKHVEKMNVVNDNAERAAALIQSFNAYPRKYEEQLNAQVESKMRLLNN